MEFFLPKKIWKESKIKSLTFHNDFSYLWTLETDEKCVEAVRIPVRLDPDSSLAYSSDTLVFRIASPRKT